MFKLLNITPNLNVIPYSNSYFLQKDNLLHFPTFKLNKTTNSLTSTNDLNIVNLEYSGDKISDDSEFTIDVSTIDSFFNLEYIKINNKIFQNSSLKEIYDNSFTEPTFKFQSGQFKYNSSNKTITIKNYKGNIISPLDKVYVYTKSNNKIKTNLIKDFPEELKNINLTKIKKEIDNIKNNINNTPINNHLIDIISNKNKK